MLQMKKNLFAVVIIGVLSLFINGCKTEEEPDPVVNTISDENFYGQLGSALVSCYNDIYNQNLAGKPTGVQNITTEGPMGGVVIITGSDAYDNTHGITTTDLVFTMTNVEYSKTVTSSTGKTVLTQIKLNGNTTHSGSFSDSYTSVNHQSSDLHIVAKVTYDGATRSIDQTGTVSINRSSSTSVNIFGYVTGW